MVVNGRGHIKTVKELIPRPSVIRLEMQIHRPRPRVKLTRREVFRRDNYTAVLREARGRDDGRPRFPRHMGGQRNDKTGHCLPHCSHHKGGQTEEEYMHLHHVPKNRLPAPYIPAGICEYQMDFTSTAEK
jgi:5-methylcytosine-specific restriction endonuclease McrA